MAAFDGLGALALPIMTVLGGALDYGSKTAAGQAMIQQAQRKKAGADLSATALETNAGQQVAASSYAAADASRIADLQQSRMLAVLATQGGATSDPTLLGIRARMMSEQAYKMQAAIYQGAEAARGMKLQAEAQRYMGEATMEDANAAKQSADIAGVASLVKTGSNLMMQSMYSKFNGGLT